MADLTQINNGDDADATVVMANLNAINTDVTTALTGTVAATRLDWAGATVPVAAIPTSQISTLAGAVVYGVDGDPLQVRAQGYPFTRRHVVNWATTPTDVGYVAPIKLGFLVCNTGGDAVLEVARNTTGGQDDLLATQLNHAFGAADDPIHAVAIDSQTAYVSCQGSRLIRRITLNSASAPTTVIDLSATYAQIGRIFTNRNADYLYVAARVTADVNFRRLVRVDIRAATPVATECSLADDFSIVDVVVCYSGSAGASATGQVLIAQFDTTAAGGSVFRNRESSTGAYGGTWAATPDGTVKSYASPEFIYAMVGVRNKVAVLTQNATTISCHWLSYDESPTPGLAELFDSTIAASTPVLVRSAAATDGYNILCQRDDGKLVWFVPTTATGVAWSVHTGLASAAGTYTFPAGMAFTGKTFAGAFRVTANGNAKFYML